MWTNEVIMMIVRGIGETVYMSVVSTLLGYVFGLPIGVLLAVTDKDGIPSECGVLQDTRCDREHHPKRAVFDPFDLTDSVYQSACRKKLRIDGDDCSACDRSSAFYRAHGRILLKGSRQRCD